MAAYRFVNRIGDKTVCERLLEAGKPVEMYVVGDSYTVWKLWDETEEFLIQGLSLFSDCNHQLSSN